ncbi:hypothetical protein [Nocardioides ferulae]|uniref:hypothetical protein n=1 Tax=Nocardioides ferulae TaxID=2340821 RepID=UPI000EAE0BEC|nr:hypothetical protein [Nocardioides ferulae]
MWTIWVAAAVLLLAACSPGEPAAPEAPPAGTPEAAPSATPARPPAVQRLPERWASVPLHGGLPRRAPADSDALPDVLGAGVAARLAYHPTERWEDPVGWAGEQVLFWGVDGRWRVLGLADLGLPDAWWPGPDTYGPGRLSADGRRWAAHTNAGVVFVDLTEGTVRHVDFPRGSRMVRYVEWLPGRNAVSAYGRAPGPSPYRTFHVTPGGKVTPVPYTGWRSRFDTDGTPVELVSDPPTGLRVTRWEGGTPERTTWDLPRDFRRGRLWGVFGETHVAVFEPPRGGLGSTMIWVFDTTTGEPVARLRVPLTSIEGWLDAGSLLLLVDSRRLVVWQPLTGRFLRSTVLPGPYPAEGEWAAATVSLP